MQKAEEYLSEALSPAECLPEYPFSPKGRLPAKAREMAHFPLRPLSDAQLCKRVKLDPIIPRDIM